MLLEAKLSPMNLGEQRICNRIAESEEDQDTSAFLGINPTDDTCGSPKLWPSPNLGRCSIVMAMILARDRWGNVPEESAILCVVEIL
jgi:hypothetical protein